MLWQAQYIECGSGSQFTSIDFTAVMKQAEIAISTDGKGAWRDKDEEIAKALDLASHEAVYKRVCGIS